MTRQHGRIKRIAASLLTLHLIGSGLIIEPQEASAKTENVERVDKSSFYKEEIIRNNERILELYYQEMLAFGPPYSKPFFFA